MIWEWLHRHILPEYTLCSTHLISPKSYKVILKANIKLSKTSHFILKLIQKSNFDNKNYLYFHTAL